MQKFLLTWFKKKFLEEKKKSQREVSFLRDLGRSDSTVPSRGQGRSAVLLSHGVTEDAAPVPHASLASRSSWPSKGKGDSGLVSPGPGVMGGFPLAGMEQHCPVGVTCHAGACGA